MKKHKTLLSLLLCITVVLTACTQTNTKVATPISRTTFLLNTVITITLYDSNDSVILDGVIQLIEDYEQIYSRTLESSELYQLNHRTLPVNNGGYIVSDQLKDLIEYGLAYGQISSGNFDITIAPISSLWNFTDDTVALPTKDQIQDQLPFVDYQQVTVTDNTISFAQEEIQIDLGGIAKGYIADRIKEYLINKGVKRAMINLGGNILAVGQKDENTLFRVGVQKPFADRNEVAAILDINDYSVVSSGIYERYRIQDGVLYHHILNPKTGFSYENNLIAVTILSKNSADGDALSTTCYALGLEEGLKLINDLEDTYAIFITEDYQIHYSEGLRENFKISEP